MKIFFRKTFELGAVLSLSIYAWVKLLFHDFPFELAEEIAMITWLLFAGWIMTTICVGSLKALLYIADHHKQLSAEWILRVHSLQPQKMRAGMNINRPQGVRVSGKGLQLLQQNKKQLAGTSSIKVIKYKRLVEAESC